MHVCRWPFSAQASLGLTAPQACFLGSALGSAAQHHEPPELLLPVRLQEASDPKGCAPCTEQGRPVPRDTPVLPWGPRSSGMKRPVLASRGRGRQWLWCTPEGLQRGQWPCLWAPPVWATDGQHQDHAGPRCGSLPGSLSRPLVAPGSPPGRHRIWSPSHGLHGV